MTNVHTISSDRRKNDDKIDSELRSAGYIAKDNMESHLTHLRWEYETTAEFVKDKEKKKQFMVGGSFAVFSILVTVLGLSTNNFFVTKAPLFLIILFGMAIMNICIIKYIACMKAETVRGIRHMNCIRQAILAVVYTKLHGKYPKTQAALEQSDSAYWEVIGRHIKFPIDNRKYRKRYNDDSIKWDSPDFFSIKMIGVFTATIAVYPILIVIFSAITDQNAAHISPEYSALLGAIGVIVSVIFIVISKILVDREIKRVREEMAADAGGQNSAQPDSAH